MKSPGSAHGLLTFFKISFFKMTFFKKIFHEHLVSESQTVWIQIRPDFMSGLIWVQTVCKNHKQMTKFAAGRQSLIISY